MRDLNHLTCFFEKDERNVDEALILRMKRITCVWFLMGPEFYTSDCLNLVSSRSSRSPLGGDIRFRYGIQSEKFCEHLRIVLLNLDPDRGQRLVLQGTGDFLVVTSGIDDVIDLHTETGCLRYDRSDSQQFDLVQELVLVLEI